MYKMLMFLKKTEDGNVEKHFRNFTLPILRELTGKELKAAKVESSLLIDKKYEQIHFNVTDENNNPLENMDIIFVNYEEES